MPLSPGTRLGPYEILSPIGAGGMGEVYRARDTRLERTVAVKVLPSHLTSKQDLRQRLEREARAISSLNHPNICTLYDVGHQNGIDYLVMEYIDGETLASRLRNGPLQLVDALQYSIQIANALDRAHRQGIVHRDLKPGNIIVTKSGLKLLDFGLAKYTAPSTEAVSKLETGEPLTQAGAVIGTFQYMAPEQLEGGQIDARTDIFAFGAVLYEMLTGKYAFEGKTQASLIAAILKEEPQPVSKIQPLIPPFLERFVKTSLAKDPEDRWQTAHDAKLQLEGILDNLSHPELHAKTPALHQPSSKFAWILAAILAAVSALLAALYFTFPQKEERVLQLELAPPDPKAWFTGTGPMTVSPDVNYIAFLNNADVRRSIWLRAFNSSSARELPRTEQASSPFWSPDSRYLGYFSKGKLMKIEIDGSRPQVLCDTEVTRGGTSRGGSWGTRGIIIFADRSNGPLYQVAASGGEKKALTKLNRNKGEITHRFPIFLPDGNRFLYLVRMTSADQAIYAGALDSDKTKSVLHSTSRVHYTPGYILYGKEGKLLAQEMDEKTLEVKGEPYIISKQLFHSATGQSVITTSRNGILAYWTGNVSGYKLSWFDRTGQNLGTMGEGATTTDARYHRLSPDGTQMAWLRPDPDLATPDIWITDTARNVSTRLTAQPEFDLNPTWSPDGKTVLFNRDVGDEEYVIYSISASGVGSEQIVLKEGVDLNDLSSDGKWIIGQRTGKKSDLWIVPMTSSPKPYPLVASEFQEFQGAFAPDTRWIAYTSDESGDYEVYVQPFPVSGKKWRISTNGGAQPHWRADGKELFYLALDRKLMAVDIKTTGENLEAGGPRILFETQISSAFYPLGMDYDVTRDGLRFLVATTLQQQTQPANIIFNWPALLKKQ
jgi:serine/threonine protein kinase